MNTGSKGPTERRFASWHLLLLLLAFAVRVAVAVAAPQTGGDSALYMELGSNLLHSGTLGVTAPDGTVQPIVAREPGYPLFLAMVGGSPTGVALAQAVLSTVTCWLLFLLAERLTRSRGIGLLVLAAAALNPYLVRFSATVLTETLAGFLLTLAVALLVLPPPRPATLAAAGAALGALALTRLQYAPLAVAFGALYLVLADRAHRRLALPAALAFLALMSLWWARNYLQFGEVILARPRFIASGFSRDAWVPRGYHAWFNTWLETEDELQRWLWRVDPRVDLLPERATGPDRPALGPLFEAMAERGTGQPVEALLTPELDGEFARLAEQRQARQGPLDSTALLARRCAHLWLDLPRHYSALRLELPTAASVRERGLLREARRGLLVLLFLSHYAVAVLALAGLLALRREPCWAYAVVAVGWTTLVHPMANVVESRALLVAYPLTLALAGAGVQEIGHLLGWHPPAGGARSPGAEPRSRASGGSG